MTPEDKARIKKAYRERAIAVEAVLPKRSFADPRITALQAENEKLRAALREHHNWQMNFDFDDPEYGFNYATEYADSGMCERTLAALEPKP